MKPTLLTWLSPSSKNNSLGCFASAVSRERESESRSRPGCIHHSLRILISLFPPINELGEKKDFFANDFGFPYKENRSEGGEGKLTSGLPTARRVQDSPNTRKKRNFPPHFSIFLLGKLYIEQFLGKPLQVVEFRAKATKRGEDISSSPSTQQASGVGGSHN